MYAKFARGLGQGSSFETLWEVAIWTIHQGTTMTRAYDRVTHALAGFGTLDRRSDCILEKVVQQHDGRQVQQGAQV